MANKIRFFLTIDRLSCGDYWKILLELILVFGNSLFSISETSLFMNYEKNVLETLSNREELSPGNACFVEDVIVFCIDSRIGFMVS